MHAHTHTIGLKVINKEKKVMGAAGDSRKGMSKVRDDRDERAWKESRGEHRNEEEQDILVGTWQANHRSISGGGNRQIK